MAFPSNCDGRFVAVDASSGCSLTRANILGMTPAVFEAQGFTETMMDRVITSAKEARVAGYRESFLQALLMSRMVGIGGELKKTPVPNESVILPYVYRRQKRNINSNYWSVVSGSATPGAGSNGLHPGCWDLIVKNNVSTYGTNLASIERFFLPGKYVLVETVDPNTKAAYAGQFKIVAAVNADSGGVNRASLTLEPNYSSGGWGSLTTAQKAPWTPALGLVLNLANSVSDFESWCRNEPSDNNQKLLTFWMQTSRETHEYSDEYLKALNAALTSGYFKNFRQLPLAEQKAQQHAQYMKSWLNSAFFGQRINEFQAVETYRSLPQVVDPANTDCTLEFKSNALGFEQQLIDCSRHADMVGAPLNLEDVFAQSYDLKRAREATGGTVDRIDWGCDRTLYGQIRDKMIAFYKSKYGVNIERHYAVNQKLSFEGQTELTYDVYEIPAEYGGFELGIFHDDYFSDKLKAAGTDPDQRNRHRRLWGLDWSDIQIGIGGTASVPRQTNEADNLYNCVVKINKHHFQLASTQWTSIIEDPTRHFIFKNFSGECPILGVTPCT